MEGVQARREEELAMAPVPPEGCRKCEREGGEVNGNIDGGDDDGVCPPPSLLTIMDKIEEVVLQLMELVDDGMKDRRRT